ncbi:hypothetical protein JCM11641_000390 [Rhodosporidiobolus odoratus]
MSSRSPSPLREDSPPLQLDPATLAILGHFMDEKAETERQFAELEKKAHERMVAAKEGRQVEDEQKMISPAEFRRLYGEDWQMSQFWYSDAFASHFSRFLYTISTSPSPTSLTPSSSSTPPPRIAFLSCPTSYVAFQHQNPLPDTWLFEYDTRFRLFAHDKFVHYDLEEPEKFPQELRGTVDIAIADPPFLNATTNRYFRQTLLSLLKPTGKLLLLTSTSVTSRPQIYSEPPIGPLHETSFEVEHAGGRLQNDFRCWSSWKWEGEIERVKIVEGGGK